MRKIYKQATNFLFKICLALVFLIVFANESFADYTVGATPVDASTITGQSGTLYINGTLNINGNVSLLNFTAVVITCPGQIYWNGNYDLTFSAGITFDINNFNNSTPTIGGLQPTSGNGNASTRLVIGATTIAVQNDNANNAAYSFEEFNKGGGLPKFNYTASPTSLGSICYGTTFSVTLTPFDNVVAFDCTWSISPSNGSTFTPSTASNFTGAQTTTVTPAISASPVTYVITCTIKRAGDNDLLATKTVSVIVNQVSAYPTAFSVSGGGSYCAGGSGKTVSLASSQSGVSYQLYNGASATGSPVTGTGAAISFGNQTAAGTYTVVGTNAGGCSTTMTGNAVVSITSRPTSVISTSTPSICNGGSATISIALTGTANWNLTYSDGTTPVTISGITSSPKTLTLTPGTAKTYTVTALSDAACTSIAADLTGTAKVGIHNLWTGSTSNDFNTASNWSDGLLPTTSCTTIIPSVTLPAVYPILSSGTATIGDLQINSGASLTLTGGLLQIAGSITNSGGTLDATNGAIDLNGSTTQTISGSVFYNNKIKDLTLNNSGTLSGTNPLALTGTLSFGSSGKTFTTNDNLTLKSSATGTATVGQVGTNIITGKVTVERFMSSKRAWRFLSIPTNTTQTIKEAWQEGATSSNSDPVGGYGTQITDSISNNTTLLANGFDYFSPAGPSVKQFDPATNKYKGIAKTTSGIYSSEGYMVFWRGNRSSIGYYATATSGILRTKGTLINSTQTYTVVANKFKSIGNPYAAPLDMRKILINGNPIQTFYVWDPLLTGSGFGAFQTFTKIGSDYYPSLDFGSYPSTLSPYNYIQSGLAFFVDGSATGAGTLTINETCKATSSQAGNLTGYRGINRNMPSQIRTNLYSIEANGSKTLVDGTLNLFGSEYSNAIDNFDAKKLVNFGESLGIKKDSQLLVVERRKKIVKEDTVRFNMFKMKAKSYRFEFVPSDFDPSFSAFLEDSYTNARTPLNLKDTSVYNFTVENIPGSWNPERFRIVFSSAAESLPVKFTGINAALQNKNIVVNWTVENEKNIKGYVVEKSEDGRHFNAVASLEATPVESNNIYTWLDENVSGRNNYYRIKSVSNMGELKYTEIAKVLIPNNVSQIVVYPNPITDGNINLQLLSQPKGIYQVRLLTQTGQLIMSKEINHAEGSSTEKIKATLLSKESYYLEVIKPDSSKRNITLIH